MHSRRIATFLLGAWIGGCVLMGLMELQNLRSPALVLDAPVPPAAKMIQTLGQEQTRLLLRHFAAQQTRHDSYLWEELQIPLGFAVLLCLFFGTRRRILPLVLCAMMLGLVVFRHIAITPELSYRGPETDFPPGNAALGPMARLWAMQQVYAGVEIVKLIVGGALASYLFFLRPPRRIRKEVDTIDHTHQGHVNR